MAATRPAGTVVHPSGLIFKTPNVCGGDACIRSTRIMVWLIESFRRHGAPIERIFEAYPGLTREDVFAAWDYAERHRDEIDEAIRDNAEG